MIYVDFGAWADIEKCGSMWNYVMVTDKGWRSNHRVE